MESALEYRFSNPELLRQALTHSSLAHELETKTASENGEDGAGERPPSADNEQFEFLGDAVLGLVTSELLFQRFPDYREGRLSKMRAHLVSARHLVKIARGLQLGRFLLLGRGEERSGGRAKPALLADALEALIAAVYLDGGMESARKVIINRILEAEVERLETGQDLEDHFKDYKSALQEWVQAKGFCQPSYSVVSETGPDHRKLFTMEVRIQEQGAPDPLYVAEGQDSTKKKAEQQAARLALEHLRAHEPVQAQQS
ncbi:MAG: ribonuclease III [Acidobacteria bacterium]|nr:ribonuclease III [Acidobacteriota bacterium]MBV9146676.1 ribonuclease III [Acidobacteriota bacterium]